jgi:uncharacterized protein
MSDEVLRETTRKVLEHNSGGGVFCWHGGEPALAGLDFFERAVELQSQYGDPSEIVNEIQTNGSRVTPSLAKFFRDNRFSVGVSLDGPEFVHDAIRLKKNGGGTYKDVVRGIDVLRDAGVTPSVIATVGRNSLAYPKEILHHLVGLGFETIHFSVVFSSIPDQGLAITNDEWYGFLREVFHEWCAIGDPDIEIRELTEVIAWLSGSADPCCTSLGTCAHWFVIDYNGDILPCEMFGHEWCYGNILKDTFADVLQTPQHRQLIQFRSRKPEKCVECEFVNVCDNGCTKMRLLDGVPNPLGIYAYCEQRLALFQEVKITFEQAV